MNIHDIYKEELATKKTLSSKKSFLTRSEKQIKEHLSDLLEQMKNGPSGSMKYAYLHGEPVTHIRISRAKTELKVIQNLKITYSKIKTMKSSGLKKPTVRGLKKLCSHVVKATGLKVNGSLKKGYKYATGGKIVKIAPAVKKPVAKKKPAVKKPVAKKKPAVKKPVAKKKTAAKK